MIEHTPADVDASAHQLTEAERELRELLDDLGINVRGPLALELCW